MHYWCMSVGLVSIMLAASDPKISIITSVYKADKFIAGFLEDIVKQTIFDQCELILINAHSPGHEESIISSYLTDYPNIRYLRLDHDPGLYAVWNQAIRMASGQYITNANVDDRLRFDCYELHAGALDTHSDISLVYSDFYVTYYANVSFATAQVSHTRVMPEFSILHLYEQPLPNNHPMWRKSVHEQCGFFDEQFLYAGDWEFWLRLAASGARFMKVPGILGLYYYNPRGLSTNIAHAQDIAAEEYEIKARYADLVTAKSS